MSDSNAGSGAIWVLIGAVAALISVAMGAFGAHSLQDRLDARSLAVFHTAAQYEMYHALALLGLGLWSAQHPAVSTSGPGWFFTAGIVLFSGSLYALSLSGVKILGAITPLGGVAFLIGWAWFAALAARS